MDQEGGSRDRFEVRGRLWAEVLLTFVLTGGLALRPRGRLDQAKHSTAKDAAGFEGQGKDKERIKKQNKRSLRGQRLLCAV